MLFRKWSQHASPTDGYNLVKYLSKWKKKRVSSAKTHKTKLIEYHYSCLLKKQKQKQMTKTLLMYICLFLFTTKSLNSKERQEAGWNWQMTCLCSVTSQWDWFHLLLLGELGLLVFRWSPLQTHSVHCNRRLLVLRTLEVLLDQFGRDTDNVLTLPVFHHVEGLECADDVTLGDTGHLAEVFDGKCAPKVPQDLQQHPGPVAPVAQLAQVRKWLLWRANRALQLRELITESYEEFSIASALVGGQGEDTSHVVPVRRLFLLGEVAHYVSPLSVDFGQDVEDKRLHVKVQRLVVQEELGQ